MRIDQFAPANAGLAKKNFTEASSLVIHPLDAVFNPKMQIREYIRRGQEAGFFSEDMASGHVTMRGLDDASETQTYDTATLSIRMPRNTEAKGNLPATVSIYKNVDTGAYHFGNQKGGVFTKLSSAKDDQEISQAIVKWAVAFAGDNRCKQSSCQKTFEQQRMNDPVNPIDVVKGLWKTLSTYMQRGGDEQTPAPRV